MKLSLAAVMAGTLWASVAHAQVLPSSGPESSIPVGPDDRPLVNRSSDDLFIVTGLWAGMPGPFLPNPSDPTRVLSKHPGVALDPE
jgi:hypothetical protein